jgi:hypothetical protein
MPAFTHLLCYPNLLPFEPTEANVDAFMATLAEAGVTHVQVNHLPDLLHPESLNQPDNFYLSFANFGPPLDLFVASSLNRGLYPELYLDRNRRILVRFAEGARRHGLQPLLYLCEPRFVPERFFQRHPTLRGPRVDNPTCSTRPLYALCTDLPEVRAHYREMLSTVLDLVPDLSMISIFTSDSGSGFDYNPDTYAGPNGAGFNRRYPIERRVLDFLGLLLEEGQRVNPAFTVNLTSGFSPALRARILALAPEGIVGSVYGLYDWEGGLEEHWAYHQAMFAPETLDRDAARAARMADMQERFDVAATKGRSPVVHAELPTYDYPRPLRYTPHPFEVVRLAKANAALGATRLSLWGRISPKTLVPWDANLAALHAANAAIDADPAVLVRAIAAEWVGEAYADVLTSAWAKCDAAITTRPLWDHAFTGRKDTLPGPLAPDPAAVTPAERAYYRTIQLDDLEQTNGLGYYVPHQPDEMVREYILRTLYEGGTFPLLAEALALLEGALVTAAGQAAAVLAQQRDHIRCFALYMRSSYNWLEAGRYIVPGAGQVAGRPLPEIIDDEIRVTENLIALLDGRADMFLCTFFTDAMTDIPGPGFVDQLRQRIAVMRAHRDDPPGVLNERLAKLHAYLQTLDPVAEE